MSDSVGSGVGGGEGRSVKGEAAGTTNKGGKSSTQEPETIDINSVSPRALGDFARGVEQSIIVTSQELAKLRSGMEEFRGATKSIEKVRNLKEGQQSLVALTTSVYVKGECTNVGHVLVDVGGGYFVQKKAQDAKAYCEKRANLLQEKGTQLAGEIAEKRKILEIVKERLAESLQKSVQGTHLGESRGEEEVSVVS